MFWTIDLMYAVVMTSVTGTLVTITWYWIGKLLERIGFLNVLYDLLRVTMLFWFVPVAYGLEWYFGTIRKSWTDIFIPSPMILEISRVFCLVWGVGVVFHMVWYLKDLICAYMRVRDAIECEIAVRKIFSEMCGEYGIKEARVQVMRSCRETVPKVVGVLHPKLLMSMKEYSTGELQVIFSHELMHIKKRDLLLKNFGMLLRALHFWNPAAWWYARLLNKWSEFSCDYRVCTREHNLKNYYGTILDMVEKEETIGLFSQLVETKGELEERMEHVMRCYHCTINRRTRMMAAVIVGCMTLASGEAIYAATAASSYAMTVWSHETEVVEKELLQNPMLLEEYEEGIGFDTIVVNGEVDQSAKSTRYRFDWNVGAGVTCQSSNISKQQGGTITVNVTIDPDDLNVRVGIIKPDGSKTYVKGSDTITHEFLLSQTGTYRVYVENRNSVSVTAVGSYK